MALGFKRAGIEITMAFDKDADACSSYEANLGHRPVQMDARDLLRMVRAGWSLGPIDLAIFDPPCTPWSRAGKRLGVEDERDMLIETCDLIALLRPRAYLIGNVPGLNDGPSWKHVQDHIGGLRRHGYCVADYAELDAAAYGVPQHRIRPFWFGHLAGPCLRWPEPTHGPADQEALPGLGLQPFVTCRDALQHLPLADLGRPVRVRWKTTDDHRPTHPDEPAKTLTRNTHSDGCLITLNERHAPSQPSQPSQTIAAKQRGQGGNVLLTAEQHGHPTSKVDAPAWTITSEGGRAGKRSSVLEVGRNGRPRTQAFRTGRPDAPGDVVTSQVARVGSGPGHTLSWPWDRPATTIARDERIPPPGHHAGNAYLSHPNAIVLSEKAAAILQGFPETWVFAGKTKRARWSQLGQAMPPGLAEPVARAIAQQIAASSAREAAE
jgi:site-specific DNA-cytosine methylase